MLSVHSIELGNIGIKGLDLRFIEILRTFLKRRVAFYNIVVISKVRLG